MAISNGIKGMISGSAGDLTYSVKGGELVISARVSKMTNPRTSTQMIQRIKFPNIVARPAPLRRKRSSLKTKKTFSENEETPF